MVEPATDLMILVILSYIDTQQYRSISHLGTLNWCPCCHNAKNCSFFPIFSGDGTCKHVAAFLFGLQRFCASLVDTSEVSVTDEKAKWINPNRTTVSAKVATLDLRCDPS